MDLVLTGNADADARNVFSLGPSVAAVVLDSDLVAGAKHRRLKRPVARRLRQVVDDVLSEARAGNLAAAKALAAGVNPALPPAVWWVESEGELACHLSKLHALAKRHGLATGWNADLITERVAPLQIWND